MQKTYDSESLDTCCVCTAPVDASSAFSFIFNEENFYFCDDHAAPFRMGLGVGQMELNAKVLSYISDLPDPVSKNELKRAFFNFAPMTHIQRIDYKPVTIQNSMNINTPKDLYDEVGKVVIGQEIARKAVSVSVINHLTSLTDISESTHSDKHHVLLLGKSGSGKTLIASTVAGLLQLPFVSGDATGFSPTGFQGADADSVAADLLLEADMNFDLAERGVVFIDEIDKICSSSKAGRYESFIGSTQSTLLKLVEGKMVKVPGPVYGDMPGTSANVSSSRMLFFFGGAFNGLSDILAKNKGLKGRAVGFRSSESNDKSKELDEAVKSYEIFSQSSREEIVEALIEYGMLSELVGRIPTIVPLKPMMKDDLIKVMHESAVSPIKKQVEIFGKSGYTLTFTDEFIDKVASLSQLSATGTRSLDSYVKHAVSFASFDLLDIRPGTQKGDITIGEDCVTDPSAYALNRLQTGFVTMPATL